MIGYYGMLAASLGCKVLMFDPQPQVSFLAFQLNKSSVQDIFKQI